MYSSGSLYQLFSLPSPVPLPFLHPGPHSKQITFHPRVLSQMCSEENQAKTQKTGMPGQGRAQGTGRHNVTCLKYGCELQEVVVGVYF